MEALRITPLPVLKDNYAYLLEEPSTGTVAVVDPSEAGPIAAAVHARGGRLDFVINTHHHWDHVGGNLALKEAFGSRIVGPERDRERIPGMEIGVREGEPFRLGAIELFGLEVPGHTTGAIAYYSPAARAVFTGDTLFLSGCGRLFEGTPAQMFESLGKLKRLPGDTRVYCGHEYTISNTRFALTVEPENAALKARLAAAEAARAEGKPTVPATMDEERAANPFLRAPNVERFTEIRRAKDEYR